MNLRVTKLVCFEITKLSNKLAIRIVRWESIVILDFRWINLIVKCTE